MASGPVFSTSKPPSNIFTSVFTAVEYSQPTPEATPVIGTLSSPARPFGGGLAEQLDNVNPAVQLTQAWSVSTRYLQSSLQAQDSPRAQRPGLETRRSLTFLCASNPLQKDLLVWYLSEVASHFRTHVLAELSFWSKPIPRAQFVQTIRNTIDLLTSAQRRYLHGLQVASSGAPRSERSLLIRFIDQVRLGFHRLISQSLPRPKIEHVLEVTFYDLMSQSLTIGSNIERCFKAGECLCDIHLGNLPLAGLCEVGLAEIYGEQSFAHAVYKLVEGPALERHCFLVDWSGQKHVITLMQKWIETKFAPFIQSTLAILTNTPSYIFTLNDQIDLFKIAVNSLGRQRTSMLYEYVNRWPASEGAIRDLREFIALNGPTQKAQLCSSFSSQLGQRLLHSGASTSEILSIYINLIHAFRALDARGVLLEKVAAPVRAYLRSRDDTVNIIAASLLTDSNADESPNSVDTAKICLDIPLEVERSAIEGRREETLSNWNDMAWLPDPIDAGPDYKSSTSEDVVAYILGLFEQDDFIHELRNVLATSLLESKDSEFVRETRLIELLKARLDATKLQAIEVMLKDVRDSVVINKRINPVDRHRRDVPPTPREVRAKIPAEGITMQSLYRMFEERVKQPQFVAIVNTIGIRRQNRIYPKRTRTRPRSSSVSSDSTPDFQVQIISKNFWPDLAAEDFKLPAVLEEAQADFNARFEKLGGQRKLHFRPALGRVTVELELDDRTIKEENVQTWKASVIHAFDSSTNETVDPVTHTAPQLAEILLMDEDLVTTALHFWLGKKALCQPSKGTFAVLERLDMDSGIVDADVLVLDETVSAIKSHDAMLQASAPMFCTFIAHMLRNAGPKEVDGMMGITGMLKMVCPMFTYGDDEVRWLLGEMEGRGEVTRNGEVWTIV